jgi:Phage integrase family
MTSRAVYDTPAGVSSSVIELFAGRHVVSLSTILSTVLVFAFPAIQVFETHPDVSGPPMVQLGFEGTPRGCPRGEPLLVGAALTTSTPAALRRRGPRIGWDCEKKTSFHPGPRFCLETPHRTPQVFGGDDGNCSLDSSTWRPEQRANGCRFPASQALRNTLKKRQVDFLRNMVTPTETKNGKDRDIPMNVEVRAAFFELCKNKLGDDYVFASPKTDGHLTEVKKGFKTALCIAGIEGLRWHDLRATFGTLLSNCWRPVEIVLKAWPK